MKTQEFNIEINAPAATVWFTLWDDFHYRLWTSVFCQGSYMVTNWLEGDKVHFLSPDGKGMYSRLVSNKPQKEMFFQHLGEIQEYKEMPLNDETATWSGAREYYSLEDFGEKSLLTVTLDLDEKFADYFIEIFPKALQKIKELAENFEIFVQTSINNSLENVWKFYSHASHIVNWNAASDDWHTTKAEIDFVVGGKFCYRMEAKDGSFGFDFEGVFTKIDLHSNIEILLGDGRIMKLNFTFKNDKTTVIESFNAENENSFELQRNGWQAILDNFKRYAESKSVR